MSDKSRGIGLKEDLLGRVKGESQTNQVCHDGSSVPGPNKYTESVRLFS